MKGKVKFFAWSSFRVLKNTDQYGVKKILKLVNNKIFEIKTVNENGSPIIVVEVVYLFKKIDKDLES